MAQLGSLIEGAFPGAQHDGQSTLRSRAHVESGMSSDGRQEERLRVSCGFAGAWISLRLLFRSDGD
jgi:hypothetical protein